MPRKNKGLTAKGEVKKPKPDSKCKSECSNELNEAKKNDKGKVSLFIKPALYIMVTPENCNKEYAANYLKMITP